MVSMHNDLNANSKLVGSIVKELRLEQPLKRSLDARRIFAVEVRTYISRFLRMLSILICERFQGIGQRSIDTSAIQGYMHRNKKQCSRL
jgi:hypothetical protein